MSFPDTALQRSTEAVSARTGFSQSIRRGRIFFCGQACRWCEPIQIAPSAAEPVSLCFSIGLTKGRVKKATGNNGFAGRGRRQKSKRLLGAAGGGGPETPLSGEIKGAGNCVDEEESSSRVFPARLREVLRIVANPEDSFFEGTECPFRERFCTLEGDVFLRNFQN